MELTQTLKAFIEEGQDWERKNTSEFPLSDYLRQRTGPLLLPSILTPLVKTVFP
jgi:predicted Rdx family selenoprotein